MFGPKHVTPTVGSLCTCTRSSHELPTELNEIHLNRGLLSNRFNVDPFWRLCARGSSHILSCDIFSFQQYFTGMVDYCFGGNLTMKPQHPPRGFVITWYVIFGAPCGRGCTKMKIGAVFPTWQRNLVNSNSARWPRSEPTLIEYPHRDPSNNFCGSSRSLRAFTVSTACLGGVVE